MKIRIQVEEEKADEIRERLLAAGFEIGEDGEYVLTEVHNGPELLTVRDSAGQKQIISPESVIYLESYGHNVEVHTTDGLYLSSEPLYRLCEMLDMKKYVRISSSVVVAKKHVKKIKPSLSMKFILTLSDGTRADVTRSYYYSFKEFFGI